MRSSFRQILQGVSRGLCHSEPPPGEMAPSARGQSHREGCKRAFGSSTLSSQGMESQGSELGTNNVHSILPTFLSPGLLFTGGISSMELNMEGLFAGQGGRGDRSESKLANDR